MKHVKLFEAFMGEKVGTQENLRLYHKEDGF